MTVLKEYWENIAVNWENTSQAKTESSSKKIKISDTIEKWEQEDIYANMRESPFSTNKNLENEDKGSEKIKISDTIEKWEQEDIYANMRESPFSTNKNLENEDKGSEKIKISDTIEKWEQEDIYANMRESPFSTNKNLKNEGEQRSSRQKVRDILQGKSLTREEQRERRQSVSKAATKLYERYNKEKEYQEKCPEKANNELLVYKNRLHKYCEIVKEFALFNNDTISDNKLKRALNYLANHVEEGSAIGIDGNRTKGNQQVKEIVELIKSNPDIKEYRET